MAEIWLQQQLLLNSLLVIMTILYILITHHLWLIGDQLLLVICGIIPCLLHGTLVIAFYQYHRATQFEVQSLRTVIDLTFETIHNGALQNLAQVLRVVNSQDLSQNKLISEIKQELEKLNLDLRNVYKFGQDRKLLQNENIYLGNNLFINLQDPLHDILYQVYSHTLERNFPCFKTLKVKVCTFEPIDEQNLTLADKRGLCRFLEEALCNVGKYALEVNYLQVTCNVSAGWQKLSIVDDGLGVNSVQEGWGTQQFKSLARQIRGKFRRVPRSPRGTICELSWPLASSF